REVMRPKVEAALNLDELTADMDLVAFVLFSSAASTLGAAGQGNYTAANAFLDALARRRRVAGRTGTSLAWGLWEQADGMAATLDEASRSRWSRLGVRALRADDGLRLLDVAVASGEPVLVPMRLDLAALRGSAAPPPLLRGMARVPAQRHRDATTRLARRLANVPEAEWEDLLLELVRDEASLVLGRRPDQLADPATTFKELGFDSLSAVELRNRL